MADIKNVQNGMLSRISTTTPNALPTLPTELSLPLNSNEEITQIEALLGLNEENKEKLVILLHL